MNLVNDKTEVQRTLMTTIDLTIVSMVNLLI